MLADCGVFPDGYRGLDGSRPPKPTNLDELRQMLPRTRSSLCPSAFSEGAFEEFQETDRRAKSEAKPMSSVVPIITGAKDNQLETEEWNQAYMSIDRESTERSEDLWDKRRRVDGKPSASSHASPQTRLLPGRLSYAASSRTVHRL